MANYFINTDWVSMKVLRLLLNKLVIGEAFNHSWEKDFKMEFTVGDTIKVKFPQLFKVVDGQGYQPQGIDRIYTTISLDQWMQVGFQWDDYEKAVRLERTEAELEEQYFKPAATQLAQEADSRCAKWAYQNANNVLGALGTDPSSVATYYNTRARLEELACPNLDNVRLAISSSMMSTFGQNITTFFQPPDALSKMFKTGALGECAGMKWYSSQSLYSHTAGTWAGAVTVTGAGQSGTSLIITGTMNDTIKKGDKFSILNVNQVNIRTRRSPGPLTAKTFTATQDYTLTGNPDTISILPPIYGPDSNYQNVDALPADGAALTLWPGTTSPNGKVGTVGLSLSDQAFAMVGGKLYSPKATEMTSQAQDPETGIAIRVVRAWDPKDSLLINRLDALIGFGNLYQDQGACCVVGA